MLTLTYHSEIAQTILLPSEDAKCPYPHPFISLRVIGSLYVSIGSRRSIQTEPNPKNEALIAIKRLQDLRLSLAQFLGFMSVERRRNIKEETSSY